MNIPIDNLVGSVLKVTASEKLDVSQDLVAKETSSINDLLKNHEEPESEKEKSQNKKDQE